MFTVLLNTQTFACDKYVVGFKGIKDIFDNQAFVEYANKTDSCYKAFSFTHTGQAVKFISTLDVPYQLYGFSAGASSVGQVLASVKQHKMAMPYYVITVGAYKTTNVNFDKYNVKYNNYFDESGIGQKSPGMMIKGVGHANIQKFVNRSLD